MPWHRINGQDYFYLCTTRHGRKKNIYIGRGPLGQIAAELFATTKAARETHRSAWSAERDELRAAEAVASDFERGCRLLMTGLLLTTGYRSYDRQPWRTWEYGRRYLHDANETQSEHSY